ncbi:MAG: L-threonylcarbamoyladenylate synthase [Patescibacteria group bacterium]
MQVKKDIKQAIAVLKNGGVIAYATDTAYALGADYRSAKAIKRLYRIKGRDYNKPLILIAADLKQVKKIAHIGSEENRLIKEHWPGPLTILLKVKDQELKSISKDGYIGIRIPENDAAILLAEKLGYPITATSANLSGQTACYTPYCIVKQFINKVYTPDFILDGGRLSAGDISSIIKIDKGKIKIIRQGKVKIT